MEDELNSYFGEGITMEGRLKFKGTLRFDGNFKGEVITDDTLIVGNTGKIEAKVGAGSIFNMGEIIGDVKAKKKIAIFPSSNLRGNIDTPVFVAEEGAVFKGNCTMPSRPPQKVSNNDDAKIRKALSGTSSGLILTSGDALDSAWQKKAEGNGSGYGSWIKAAVVLILVLLPAGYFTYHSMNHIVDNNVSRFIFEKFSKGSAAKMLLLGDTYFEEGQLGKAISIYEGIRSQFPRENSVLRKLAGSLEKSGRNREAMVNYAAALKDNPLDTKIIGKLRTYYVNENNTGKQIELQESIVNLRPDDREEVEALYKLYTDNDRMEKALDLYSASLASSPMTLEDFLTVGRLEKNIGRLNDAIETFSKAVALYGNSLAARLKLAYAYHKTGEEANAVKEFRKVALLDPSNVEAINNNGFLLLARGKLNKAMGVFNVALKDDNDNLRSYLGLATVYSRLGNTEKAEIYCKKILDVDPEYAPALNRLAWVYARARINLDDAEIFSLASMKYHLEAPDYLDTLSEVYYQKGEYQKAIYQIERAISLRPGSKYYKTQLAKFKVAMKRASSNS